MAKRVLIAGCGYVGAATADLFLEAGWEAEGWTRHAQASELGGLVLRGVNLTNLAQVEATSGEFDVVVHAASTRGGDAYSYRCVYLGGVRNLLHRFPKARLLFVSSTSVYAQRDGSWVTEESATEPAHESGRILRETENLVLEKEGIVVRFAGLYGPGRSALLRRVLAGEALLDRTNDRFVNQIHRDDAAAAVFFLASQMEANRSQVFNVADDQPLPLSECYEWLSQQRKRTLATGDATLLPRKRGDSNKRVSNAKLKSAGWVPTYASFFSGMSASVLPSWPGATG